MPDSTNSTHWTVIVDAAAGDRSQADEFGRQYRPVVVAYLGARWRRSHLQQETDDATQEVFVDLFKEGGALQKVDRERAGGFRAYLYGVVRNVARRVEERAARRKDVQASTIDLAADEPELEHVFDRAWAATLMTQAAQTQLADATTPAAARRFDLLRLRFDEDLPIREIAKRWDVDADHLHREYPKAREEFRRALLKVIATHLDGTPGEIEREAERLTAHFS